MSEDRPPLRYVQHLPAPVDGHRIETGALQIGDDWPGLFVRGDDAFFLARMIRSLTALLEPELRGSLGGVGLQSLGKYADLIEHDVRVVLKGAPPCVKPSSPS